MQYLEVEDQNRSQQNQQGDNQSDDQRSLRRWNGTKQTQDQLSLEEPN